MRLRRLLPLGLALLVCAPAEAQTLSDHGVTATVDAGHVTLANGEIGRTWERAAFGSRIAGLTAAGPDFTLTIAGQALPSTDFAVTGVTLAPADKGGVRVTMALASATFPLLTATRTVEAYPGIAGFRTQTTLASPVPLLLSAATIDEVHVGDRALPVIHAFRAGADWRGESDWEGPEYGSLGDAHAGDWRDTRTGERGAVLSAPGEWITTALPDRRTVFSVLERNDFPSSRALYDGESASTRVDFTRDVISLGPLEESGHAENPLDQTAGRGRLITAAGLALPATFTGAGREADDEAWQFHRYLVDQRIDPYPRDVVFNTDGTDDDVISTGAKDDVDLAVVRQIAPVARRLGADVFTLDDGWQAASGDWEPDSPQHPEPRGKFAPRFPDDSFAAVREAIAPMKLGLWMSPMSFNPASETFRAHPEWACAPVGAATGAANLLTPDDGSNEAGLGIWSTGYLDHLEARLREAITEWHVRLFKFDFLVWLDCAGSNDLYEMHDRFLALIDELRADFPGVAFAIDETNDYRLFPFESVVRGPTWFTNGGPGVAQVLHNTWSLSPWVPAQALGQKVLTGAQRNGQPASTAVAATLLNEQMISDDLRDAAWTPQLLDEARTWLDWGKAHREDYLSGVVYPLLADPLDGKHWTALQSWNPETGRGALLAFRQDDPRETVTVALRNVPDGDYELRAAPDDAVVGTFSAAQLRDGIAVAAPSRGARVLTIERR
ncbi:MAG: alpha-galactosidase [Solirubrobacteraceae bacterium]